MKELVFSSPYKVTFHLMDHGFLLLEWPNSIDESINGQVIHLAQAVENQLEFILDVVPTYCSLGIFYEHKKTDHQTLISSIKQLKPKSNPNEKPEVIEIPVCYDHQFGLDIASLCDIHQFSKEELVLLHSSPTYKISFIGFLPGFMYLSGMNPKLNSPRLKTPRTKVPKGAVAIGGGQTGIYPFSSPGGWQIIGNCPLHLFDIKTKAPLKYNAGDRVKMKPISLKEHKEIEKREKEK